ncbi:hypothetical protein F5148DRAFT_990673 [Russula earlei]|uniref:Uncharacterized protein n=1 Tax=Russula earlei TaxID=71964 RepID=A0ACC0TQ23_9AGAM|nr:hypothetical protein F5148DRAFT_990673 [Russula earlei]
MGRGYGRNHKGVNHNKFLVHDDHAANSQQLKFYITAGPIWHTKTLFGHSTFGYVAYDVKSLKLVYLKDFWHIDC